MERLKDTDLEVLVLILITLFLALLNALLIPRPFMGYFSAVFIFLLQFFIAYFHREEYPILSGVLILAITAGFFEIFADHFLVEIGHLSYNRAGFFLLSSPFYMPFAWGVVIFHLAYIGWRITEELGLLRSSFLVGLLSLFYMSFYEVLAFHGNLWSYEGSFIGIFRVPLYIIMGEIVMFILLPPIVISAICIQDFKLSFFLKGFLFGSIIFLVYVAMYYVFALV